MRDNGISETDDHIIVMVPVKNSAGEVRGKDLDAEKILFLKYTVAFMLIFLALMLLISRKGVKEISDGNLDKKLSIKTGDELQTLAENFNVMTDELKKQMATLAQITAEQESIETELDVATKIQSSVLPKDFSVDSRADLFACS